MTGFLTIQPIGVRERRAELYCSSAWKHFPSSRIPASSSARLSFAGAGGCGVHSRRLPEAHPEVRLVGLGQFRAEGDGPAAAGLHHGPTGNISA
jgi:hypothetical protein